MSVPEGQPRLSGTQTQGLEQGPRVLRGQKCGRKEGSPLSGNTGQRGAGLASFTLPWYLAPWPLAWHRELSPPHTPPSEASSRQQGPLPSSHSLPVPRGVLAARLQAKAHLQGCPQLPSRPPGLRCYHSCPRASRGTAGMPLPLSVPAQRMASSWCCPTAPGSLPRRAAASDRVSTWIRPPHHPQPSTPPAPAPGVAPTSLPRIIWSQRDAKLHLR